MKHARSDYDVIQDPTGRIPHDEPVFLIRAQDADGADTVREWARRAARRGASEQIVLLAHKHADAMDAWPTKKTADLPSKL